MSVKLKSALFRDLLYLQEIISCGQLSSAARKNGIKASNLSKLMKDLEATLQKKLWIRNTRGITPTHEALELGKIISDMEQDFDKSISSIINSYVHNNLKIYIPDNLHLKKFDKYLKCSTTGSILICHNEDEADVIISYHQPSNNQELIIVKNQIGNEISQDIWVSCINTPQALELAEHIICDLHK